MTTHNGSIFENETLTFGGWKLHFLGGGNSEKNKPPFFFSARSNCTQSATLLPESVNVVCAV